LCGAVHTRVAGADVLRHARWIQRIRPDPLLQGVRDAVTVRVEVAGVACAVAVVIEQVSVADEPTVIASVEDPSLSSSGSAALSMPSLSVSYGNGSRVA
jgi:hypothetical protein